MEACKGTDIAFHQACIGTDRKDRWGRRGEVGLVTPEDWSVVPDEDRSMVRELEYLNECLKPPIAIKSVDDLPYSKDVAFVKAVYESGKTRRDRQKTL